MNKRRLLHAALACLALLAMPASRAAPPDWTGAPPWAGGPGGPVAHNFKHLFVFGDSLSDTGNDLILTATYGAAPPVPPSANPHRSYYDGRFSNGPVAFEHLWRMLKGDGAWIVPSLAAPSVPEASAAVSYAFGGTSSGVGGFTPGGFEAPGLLTQVEIFAGGLRGGNAPPNALYALWSGANDYLFFGAVDANAVVGNIASAIQRLYALGARHFLIPNLPDMGLAPILPPEAKPWYSQLTSNHNLALHYALNSLEGSLPGVKFARVDVYTRTYTLLSSNTVQNFPPGLDYLAQGASSCLFYGPANCPSVDLEAPLPPLMFWDALHPSTYSHQLLADAMVEALAK